MIFTMSKDNDALLEDAEANLIQTIVKVVSEELPNAEDTTKIVAINGIMFQSLKRICEAHHKGIEMMLSKRDQFLEESGLDLLDELGKMRAKKPGVNPV